MRTSFFLLTAVLAGTLPACKEKVDPCKEAAKYEPSVTFGAGEKQFVPVADGDTLQVSWGSQGGQHIFVSAKLTGFNPGEKNAFGDDEPGPDVSFTLYGLRPDDGQDVLGDGASWGWPLEGTPKASKVVGESLFLYEYWPLDEPYRDGYRVQVEATDTCGTTASDSRFIRINAN